MCLYLVPQGEGAHLKALLPLTAADQLADLRHQDVHRGNGLAVVVQAHVERLWPHEKLRGWLQTLECQRQPSRGLQSTTQVGKTVLTLAHSTEEACPGQEWKTKCFVAVPRCAREKHMLPCWASLTPLVQNERRGRSTLISFG